MNISTSIMAQGPGESRFTLLVQIAHLGSGAEHVARLVDLRRFGLLRRWDDLLDVGVAALFGMAGGESELVGLCFHAGKFTPAQSAIWLAGRGFKPLHFVPNSGKPSAGNYDALPSARVGRTPSGSGPKGEWQW